MQWFDLDVLDELGFSIYEKKALAALAAQGVSDAATLCREGDIPTSKIYLAMERLATLGIAEIQPTRPKLFAILPTDIVVERLVDAARQRARRFEEQSDKLKTLLSQAGSRLKGRETFADLAIGIESHVKRHLVRLASARQRILSYLEGGDIDAITALQSQGFPLMKRLARNASEHQVSHQIIFGFRHATAPALTEFLRNHVTELHNVTGLRYSGELGHPFHVIDDDLVILSLDHPFIPEGRFASLLVRDAELAEKLASGFTEMWGKAMKDLGEVKFHPMR